MGPRAFRRFWLLNTFLVLLAQGVALVYLHRPSSPYVQELWSSARYDLHEGGLRVVPIADEPWDTFHAVSSYFLPFILLALVGFGFTLYVFLRRQAKIVDGVLSNIHRGELGAQLPPGAFDTQDPLYRSFNEMTGRIDGLVTSLNEAETKRSQLLRELAHDIRTPLTSIRFLIETVADTAPDLSRESIQEKLTTALQELEYFESLVGELFLLAQVNSTGQQGEGQRTDLLELARNEIDRLTNLREAGKVQGKVTLHASEDSFELIGQPGLLQRLLRNSIENALFYAREEVQVRLSFENGQIALRIRDDGKGFSEEAIALYGTRRKSRFLDARREGKASLGLGSVIVKAIAAAHGGTAFPGNWQRSHGERGGGEVKILLSNQVDVAMAA